MSKDKMKDEQISFAEAKEFLTKCMMIQQIYQDKIKLLKAIECILLKIFYIIFRECYASQDCLKIVSVVECFELTELVEYNSVD